MDHYAHHHNRWLLEMMNTCCNNSGKQNPLEDEITNRQWFQWYGSSECTVGCCEDEWYEEKEEAVNVNNWLINDTQTHKIDIISPLQ